MYSCPYHEERTGSFHPVQGSPYYFICFGCHEKGDSIDLEAHLSGRTVIDIVNDAAPRQAEYVPEETPTTAAAYLRLRGIISPQLAEAARVELKEGRVWFPWIDYDGREVYSSGRTITGEKPKYKNTQGQRPPMYPTPGAWASESVVLVEGQIDALAAEQAGHPGFATGTSVLLEEGIPILASKKKVVLVPDADQAGVRWRDDVIEKLQGRVALWEVILPAGVKDLAEVAQQAVEAGRDPVEAAAKVLDKAKEIRSRFDLWTVDQLAQKVPPADLIKEVVTANGLCVIYGQSGHGKTFVMLDMALSIATGMEWMNEFEVKQGPVIYVAAEGMFGVVKRVEAWKKQHDVSDVEHFYVVPTAINLLTPEVEEFAKVVEQMPEPPVMIIFDTFARSMVGGDENAAKDVGRAVAAVDSLREQTGATVVLVHHTAKHNPVERGSSALRGAADTMIKVRHDGNIVITCDKQKENDAFFPVYAKLIPRGESCALQRTYL